LIFHLKKNLTIIELKDNINFIEQIYKFTLECIQYCNIINYKCLDPTPLSGHIYPIRFFGYFSRIPSKGDIKNLIFELVSILFKRIFYQFEQEVSIDLLEDIQQQNDHLFIDLVYSLELISRGM